MDRLSALSLLIVAAAGCDDKKTTAPADPPSRVNAAKVAPAQGANVEAFCDAYFAGDSGPVFRWPTLADNAAAPPAAASWRWVNVWATWCKPCIEEIPRLVRWQTKLAAGNRHVELAFISADQDEHDVAEFRGKHPEMPATLRITDLDHQGTWFKDIGLDGSPPIPIHVFVSPSGHTRCARAGGVRDQDYAAVERMLGE